MTTATQVQLRRGTAAQIAAFIGALGELVFDTTNNRLVGQDGATAGGWAYSLIGRTPVSDASYNALITDRKVAYTALTAARTVNLPAAASFPVGEELVVLDEIGACTSVLSITLAAAGSDKINGNASAVITESYGFRRLTSNGSNKWTIVGTSQAIALAAAALGGGL